MVKAILQKDKNNSNNNNYKIVKNNNCEQTITYYILFPYIFTFISIINY